MNNFVGDTLFFGVVISLIGYEIGALLKRKLKLALFNPLLISIIFVMVVLSVGRIDYDSYYEGAKYLSYLLTPATVCLAVPLYEQLELLKKHKSAIVAGIISGVIASMGSVLLFAVIFHLNHEEYVTLLPKSITTAIGMGVSEELGGCVEITVAVIIITGVLGNVFGDIICKIFHIKEPISKGLAFGASSHAIGTARAIEIGEVEGAMSGLAIAVSGIFTVVLASVCANFL